MLWAFSIFHQEDCPVLTVMLDLKSSNSPTDKATLLQVPLQCSQVDLNQFVTWILNELQPIQGGIWSSSANTGVNVFDLQHVKVNGREVMEL